MLIDLFPSLAKPDYRYYLPLYFDKALIGWVHQARIEVLTKFPELFLIQTDAIYFHSDFCRADLQARTTMIAHFSETLREAGIIQNWRDETYGVYRPGEDLQIPVFTIERGVAPFLGLRVYGIHINGYQAPIDPDAPIERLWIARRSHLKMIEPHKLDNIAAGGLSYGEKPLETAIREAMEEADVPYDLAQRLKPATKINYIAEYHQAIRNECIFAFDLPLPADFIPQINDGEVEAFYQMTPIEIERALRAKDQFKPNSGLVTLEFLIRHQLVQLLPDEAASLLEVIS